MKIFVDAMGGDNAPAAIIQGSVDAVKEYGVPLTLVGDASAIREELAKWDAPKDMIEILHADSVIGFDDEPVRAIRRKKDSSLVVALNAMKGQPDCALVSAGSTGALLAGGLFILGRIRGIKRPALAVSIPQGDKDVLLLDNGANADCKAEYLDQFGILGSIYSQALLGVKDPKVGLINIGTEAEKGNAMVKEAYALMRDDPAIHFIGNVEARELPFTEADVLVCDGFTGNVILKLIEGLTSFMFKGIKGAVMGSLKGKIGGALIKNDLKAFKKQFSSDEVGGAPFLGVNGGIIKAHGSSDAYAFKNAIRQAIALVENEVVTKIEKTVQVSQEEEINERS